VPCFFTRFFLVGGGSNAGHQHRSQACRHGIAYNRPQTTFKIIPSFFKIVTMPTKEELEHINKMLEYERDHTNKWKAVAERNARAVVELEAEISYYIKVNPALRKRYRNTIINRTLYTWFVKYREKVKGRSEIYGLIYNRALKKGWVKEVRPENVSRNIRRRLQYHCELHNIAFPGKRDK
jgi:hypothetical protein